MNFFHYKLRKIDKDQLTQSEEQILSLLMGIPPDTISFSQQWVFRLLQLFGTKEEISLFYTFFSQIQLRNTIRLKSVKKNTEQIDLQQEVLTALAYHNQQQLHTNQIENRQQIGRNTKSDWTGMSNLALEVQDLSLNFNLNQQDPSYLQQSKSQDAGSQILSQKESNNSAEQEVTGTGILPKAIRQQLRTQFQYYRDSEQQFINIAEIAKKYCISQIALGRLIKKWSYEPQFCEYLNKIQQKQQLWHIKTSYYRQIQNYGKKIEEILSKNPYLNYNQIGEQLRLHGKYKIPDEATLKKILSQMKYVRKRVGTNESGKNTQENMVVRKKYCQIYLSLLKKQEIVLFFLDQCRFDNQEHPEYGWAKVGQYLPPVANTSNFYVSLVVLLSQNFSFNFRTFINQGNPEPNLGPTLHSLFQQIINKRRQKKQVVLITTCVQKSIFFENSKVHRAKQEYSLSYTAKEASAQWGWNLMLLPPKSSELNPLVGFFKQIRQQMKKLGNKCSNLIELQQKLKQICPTLQYFKPNFDQVKKFASKGVLGCKF